MRETARDSSALVKFFLLALLLRSGNLDSPLTLHPVRQCRSISLDWAAIPTMHKKRLLRVSLSLVLICGISITISYSRRAGARAASAMSATTIFLGYTNDPAQGRLALFR